MHTKRTRIIGYFTKPWSCAHNTDDGNSFKCVHKINTGKSNDMTTTNTTFD